MGLAETLARRRGEATAVPTRRLACRRLARREALKAAGVSALPVAGADLFVNGKLLASTLGRINLAYGLGPEQIKQLPAPVRTRLESLTRELGTYLVGRALTQGLLIKAMSAVGVRVGAQQAMKLAPVIGLAASGALSGWMFLRICERHIEHCEAIAAQLPQLQGGPGSIVIDI